jgi:hypothetical protein
LQRIKARKRVISSKTRRMALMKAVATRKLSRTFLLKRIKLLIKSHLRINQFRKKKIRRRRRKMRKRKKPTVCGISQNSHYPSCGKVAL